MTSKSTVLVVTLSGILLSFVYVVQIFYCVVTIRTSSPNRTLYLSWNPKSKVYSLLTSKLFNLLNKFKCDLLDPTFGYQTEVRT